MRDTEHLTPGNAEVIDGLKKALERAQSGMAKAAALVFCEHAGADVMYLGDVHARAQVVYGCELLKHLLVTSSSLNTRPLNETRSANMVRYDLTSDPICFDFLPWLVTAEMVRRAEHAQMGNAPPPLKIAFVRHPGSLAPVTEQKWAFFNNVMRPILPLFGVVEAAEAADSRHAEFVGLRDISKMYQSGIELPKIAVPEQPAAKMREYLAGRKPVTITLRETGAYDHRNSNLLEWAAFANWLEHDRDERVIVVRDTAFADQPFGNHEICPQASIDLHQRAALYSQAKLNCFVTNGPWGLAYFSDAPWLLMASVDDSQPEGFNRPQWWNMFMGLNVDKQLPWASPQQRIVYARDTFENIRDAYEDLRLAA